MMKAYEVLESKVKFVLDSDLTAYRIALDMDKASTNFIHRLRSGESKIENLTYRTLCDFEDVFDKYREEGIL